MQNKLVPHKSVTAQHQVHVSWQFLNAHEVCFNFQVIHYQANTNANFSQDYKENWGLWDFDVVEVFLKREDSQSYLEVQTSPLNQPFALIIEKPRVSFHKPQTLSLQIKNKIENSTWSAQLIIKKEDIPGQGNRLFGNCFACLGTKEKREYFALNINQEDKPDYHRPELFQLFGEFV
jgi:hypothetical protein